MDACSCYHFPKALAADSSHADDLRNAAAVSPILSSMSCTVCQVCAHAGMLLSVVVPVIQACAPACVHSSTLCI